MQGYEIVVISEEGEMYKSSSTNATHLLIKCDGLIKGEKYNFYVLVKGLCGYGKREQTFGYYPLSGGESSSV